MELVFQEKQLDYLGRVLDQTVTQELTAEVTYRTAARMRTALSMRSARCSSARRRYRGKRVGQRGGAGGYFVRHGGRTARAAGDPVIPFSARRGWEGSRATAPAMCLPPVHVDARLVHSRKLRVRVGVSLHADGLCRVHADADDFLGAKIDAAAPAQAPAARCRAASAKRAFRSMRRSEIPASEPPVERLLKCVYALDTAEQKTIGNKAVFKGG